MQKQVRSLFFARIAIIVLVVQLMGILGNAGCTQQSLLPACNLKTGRRSVCSEHMPQTLRVSAVVSDNHPAMQARAQGTEIMITGAKCGRHAGPSADAGLHLQSFRAINGLRATVTIPRVFQAFPGIINGGIVNTLFDCHGNWSAALALMDKAALPRPPFTLSSSLQVPSSPCSNNPNDIDYAGFQWHTLQSVLQVNYHEPTPPATELYLESKVVAIEDHKSTGADKVTVALELFQALPENRRRLLASGRGVFNKKGALRAM